MQHKIFGSRRFDTTECSHLQGLQYPRRIFIGGEDMINTLSQNSDNQIPSREAPRRTETLKTCKFYEIALYFAPKNTG